MNNSEIQIENGIPTMLDSPVEMKAPNDNILIHEGIFTLERKDSKTDIKGKILFKWFPAPGIYFEGLEKIDDNFHSHSLKDERYFAKEAYRINIDNIHFGKCLINRIITTIAKSSTIKVFGKVTSEGIIGDKTKKVSSVNFAIPNLKYFRGEQVVKNYLDNNEDWGSRLSFNTDEYIITLDHSNNPDILEILNAKGGYLNLHTGQLKKINEQSISLEEAHSVLTSFNCFISLLNGRRTSAFFLKGISGNDTQWLSYFPGRVNTYQEVENWTYSQHLIKYDDLFKDFYNLWQDENTCSFLELLTNWYLEANNGFNNLEASIVKGQIALELLYNFLLIEKQGLLLGQDAEKINAAKKIRLLLNHLHLNTSIPVNFENLQKYASNERITDAPETITRLRNALIHSNLKKRQKVSDLDKDVKKEVLQLCIWYIEVAIMHILKYDGLYINRCKPYNEKENNFSMKDKR
jgi:hypothetical protein